MGLIEKDRLNNKDYAELCIELKALYVAITRAKNRLIIYDKFPHKRETM